MSGSRQRRRASPAADPHLAARTQEVYERQATRFDAERSKSLHEREWLDRFLELVPDGGRILDLGCGAGDPIAAYFLDHGYGVVGLDASSEMLRLASTRFPDADWLLADMRRLDLAEHFDGVVAWNSFFHLTPAEQGEVLQRIAAHMRPGSPLLLTVGEQAGTTVGWVGGEPVYHASLSEDGYETSLDALGVEVVEFVRADPTCGDQTVLLARKQAVLSGRATDPGEGSDGV